MGRSASHRWLRQVTYTGVFVLAPILSGCRFDGVPPPEPLPAALVRERVVDSGSARLPYRIGLLPVVAGVSSRVPTTDPAQHLATPDLEAFRSDLLEALRTSSVFERASNRGVASSTPSDARDIAWDENDDLVLQLEVRDYRQEYLGHSNYAGWFVAWWWWVFTAWWVPVDYYGVGFEVHATLKSVQGSEAVLERTYVVAPAETTQELTPSDRELAGFLDMGAFYSVETSLRESNWRAIDRQVAPHAWRRFQLRLIHDLEVAVRRPLEGSSTEREKVLSRVRKRFALVTGVSHYSDPLVGAAGSSSRDATELAALLATPRGGDLVPGRTEHLLVDEAATRRGILDGIAAIASRATSSDEAILYFAGFGATLPGDPSVPPCGAAASLGAAALATSLTFLDPTRPVFLPHDAKASDLEHTALSLEELGRAIATIKAERVLVILDASFAAGDRGGRTFTQSTRPSRPCDIAGALRQGPGRTVICAASPDQAARELQDAGSSLFGYVLRAGIAGAADADGDGRVTWSELAAFIDSEVHSRSGLEGFQQDPVVYGTESGELAWPR